MSRNFQVTPRRGGTGRRRKAEAMMRDARALELYARGLSYQQISDQLELNNKGIAWQCVRRAIRDSYRLSVEELRAVEEERLDQLTRAFQQVMLRRHYIVANNGAVALDPLTGQPIVDDGPVIQAGLALLRVAESRRKLLGLDRPIKHEVRTIDAIDARLSELAEQVAAVGSLNQKALPGPAGSGGTPAPAPAS